LLLCCFECFLFLFLLLLVFLVGLCYGASRPIPYMLGYTTKDKPENAKTIEGWLGRPLDILGTTITMGAWWNEIPAPYRISVAVPMLSISGWDNLNATDTKTTVYPQVLKLLSASLAGTYPAKPTVSPTTVVV